MIVLIITSNVRLFELLQILINAYFNSNLLTFGSELKILFVKYSTCLYILC
jgi:hypothetical protein